MFLLAFFIISLIEIIAEYCEDKLVIWMTKPLILPFLILYYLKRSKKISGFFVVALLFSWIANLMFIQNTFHYIFYGVVFFLIYRILVIYIIVSKAQMPNSFPLILGSIPFISLYVIVTLYTYTILGNSVYLFMVQGIFTIFLGGFSLVNYVLTSNRQNALLLISTMFMAFNQFIFLLKYYYEQANILQAVAMILFILGQFLLTRYMITTEKDKHKYDFLIK